ncbi:HNH endonuclease [Caballeronia sp. AZ1_KS37]|uniref:HNH endonuclease n=1 Tax=Caballeronia sp. AZ1_KS37 TaxID=2921756 RepID=UPI0020293B65
MNQNQTYKHEVDGGYLWSPKKKKDGSRNYFYDTMTHAEVGDMVMSFSDTRIKAIGIVKSLAVSAPKPTEFGSAGAQWSDDGWFVEVEYQELTNKIRPADHMEILRPLLPERYSPLQATGNGNQGVYLTELPNAMTQALGLLIGAEYVSSRQIARNALLDTQSDEVEAVVNARVDIEETEKLQLVRARRGQGLFRSRVELLEKGCRLTGITDRQHLRASHIKPWCKSTDNEKLDGNNGLLLSPHVDHLFDRGYISFSNDGTLLVAKLLTTDVLTAWHFDTISGVAALRPEQEEYMDFHRRYVFLG